MGEPCGWTVTRCGCASSECWPGYRPATRDRAAALAAHFLWAATGRRYGLCEVTVLPCTPAPDGPLYQTYGLDPEASPGPYIDGGTWHNQPCSPAPCEVSLPGPVATIVEVLIDGEAVSPDAYRVYDHRLLARIDGVCWPSCSTHGEVPGFQVTYERGTPIPDAIQYAYEGLACQMAKGCEGAGDCALPPQVRSLTRQGITLEVAAEQAASQGGGKLRTGISWIDQIIEADNPYGLTEAPQVLSLDLPPAPRVITGVFGS